MTTQDRPAQGTVTPFVPATYPYEATWDLPHHPRSAGDARARLREHAQTWCLDDELVTTARLLLSELVTNACLHGRPLPGHQVAVRCTVSPTRTLRIEVTDGYPVELPYPSPASPTDISGRGLTLVASLADAWGTDLLPGAIGKTVWFELIALATEHEPSESGPSYPTRTVT